MVFIGSLWLNYNNNKKEFLRRRQFGGRGVGPFALLSDFWDPLFRRETCENEVSRKDF